MVGEDGVGHAAWKGAFDLTASQLHELATDDAPEHLGHTDLLARMDPLAAVTLAPDALRVREPERASRAVLTPAAPAELLDPPTGDIGETLETS